MNWLCLRPASWLEAPLDAIAHMQLIEHLRELGLLRRENDAPVGLETPYSKMLPLTSQRNNPLPFTKDFCDDPTQVQGVTLAALAQPVPAVGLWVGRTGKSRNQLSAIVHLLFSWLPVHANWLRCSACQIAARPT
jgi:hypothetical protein